MTTIDVTGMAKTPISEIKEVFSEVKYDPTRLIQAAIETVETLANGSVYLVDPTHPAVNLLEMACVMSANNTQEGISNLRRQYPAIAMDTEDLYLHMSDVDFINRFASASVAKFKFIVLLDDVFNKCVYDPEELCSKLIIPRDTRISVDSVPFRLLYPIVIRYYNTGVVQVSYDATIENPVQNLKANLIEASVRTSPTGESWLFFTFEAMQLDINPTYHSVDMSTNFRAVIPYVNDFYYARAFYKNSKTQGNWIEVLTTHTDQIFEITEPTVVIKVDEEEKTVTVEIPVIYLTSGLLRGELRIDVYTTFGIINMNLSRYEEDKYVVTMEPIDSDRDTSDFTLAFSEVSYHVLSDYIVSSSKPALSFQDLRKRVLYNANGPQVIPITPAQIIAGEENHGFEIEKNIDVLTNRVFLATRRLPAPENQKLITAANIGNATIAASYNDLINNENVVVNNQRATIKSNAIIKNENGKLRFISAAELSQLKTMTQSALVNELNNSRYYYSPFHYVLDLVEDTFETRAYSIDLSYAKDLDFVQQNQSLQLLVNIGSYSLTRVTNGWQLDVVTSSGNNYKALEDNQVGIQLAINPEGETLYGYINGVLIGKTEDNERMYRFTIETNYDFDENDYIALTNPQIHSVPGYRSFVSLEKTVKLIHYTTSVNNGFVPDSTDAMLGKFMLPENAVANTLEHLVCHFGDAMTRLWKRCRTYYLDTVYQRHTTDIPLYYTANVIRPDAVTGQDFSIDPDTGEVTFDYEHVIGDPVLDGNGEQVYSHRIGDVVLDAEGNPVIDRLVSEGREFDMLITDARYLFSDDEATIAYRDEIARTISDWITDDIGLLTDSLLDQTKIYFFPKTTLGNIAVSIENGGTDELEAEQLFKMELYVRGSIYRDLELREKLRRLTVKTLDAAISEPTINMTLIREQLKEVYGDSVVAFTINGLGGTKNYELVKVSSGWQRFCLKKMITIKSDRKMVVEDAIEIEFKLAV